jgi:uncharacterized protein YndB with AHSA1/START domain
MPAQLFGGAVRGRIRATPERLWEIVADPLRHPELAGSGEPRQVQRLDHGPLAVGSRFEARQQIGAFRYRAVSTITALERPRLVRWNVRDADWEFRLEPLAGDTLVVHAHRFTPRRGGLLATLLGPILHLRARQNVKGMVNTLRNLAQLAGAPPPVDLEVSYEPPLLEARR